MDVDTLEPGVNFIDLIEESLSEVEALIAVIGRSWLTTVDAQGRRRLDDDHDWVRLEIAQALERDIRVVPVLVNGATLPDTADLPADLTGLRARNALELKATDWRAGVERLVTSLERIVGPVASEPALPNRPATGAPNIPVASQPALEGMEKLNILLDGMNPGEQLQDSFEADVYPFGAHFLIGITATRLFARPVGPSAEKPRSIDLADVSFRKRSWHHLLANKRSWSQLSGALLKGNRAKFLFVPRGNMKKVLSELKSRVKAASS